MTEPMSDEMIDEALKVCAAATLGPWYEESSTGAYYHLTRLTPQKSELIADFHSTAEQGDPRAPEVIWNLALAAMARTLLPAALLALQHERQARAELVRKWKEKADGCDRQRHNIYDIDSAPASLLRQRSEVLRQAAAELESLRPAGGEGRGG